MRFVILLGVLALMAFSTTAENQEKGIDLLGEDILIRDAREAKKKKIARRGKKRAFKKKKAAKKRKNRKKNGNRRGDRKGNEEGKKNIKGKRKNRSRKGENSASTEKNNRQNYPGCTEFYKPASVRDFRYAKNQIQKVKRVKKTLAKLEKLKAKAAEAFLAGAAFFKDCSDPGAPAVYQGLSQCNVTAANACDPADLIADNLDSVEDIDECISNLNTTLKSSDDCLKENCLSTCNYIPIGFDNSPSTCDYRAIDRTVAKRINSKCSNSTYEGSFTWCNNLLKDSYSIASNCFILSTLTTVAPSTGRLRKSLNIWKV